MEYTGTVKNGRIVLDNEPALPEGAWVQVVLLPSTAPASPLGQLLLQFMARNHDHDLHGLPKK